jgi:hypothetical protein
METSIRQKNLFLTRYLYETLSNVSKKVKAVTNEAALVKMGQGKKSITDAIAREIESQLSLQVGWMDRDNDRLVRSLPTLDYEIAVRLHCLSQDEKEKLLAYVTTKQRNARQAT